jgi:TonB dependent receptor/TonB-dependent Receptor Plug Domain
MRKLFIILLFAFSFAISNSQNKLIHIKIVNSVTNEDIDGAVVTFGSQVFATENGKANIPAEVKKITISCVGYKTTEQEINNTDFTVKLEKASINLAEVAVKGSNAFKTISKIDVNTRPAKSAQDLLRIVPGLFIAQHQGGGKAEQIFLRGFDIDHGTDIALSVDGLPVNLVSHAHGQGYADLHFVIPETVNKIDFGTGPYYTNVGNFNTAGYVNFETHNTIEKNRLQLEAGQFNTARLLSMIDISGKQKQKHYGYIASEFLYSDGPFVSKQYFNRLNLFTKYSIRLNKNLHVQFLASAFNSRWNASGQVPARAVENGTINRFGSIDDTEGGYTSRYNASATITNNCLKQQFYFSKYEFNLFSNFTFFLNDPINGDQIKQREDRNIFGYNASSSFTKYLNNIRLNTTVGVGFRHDKTSNSELSHTKNKTEILEAKQLGNVNETNVFTYVDEKISINKLQFNLGVRSDYFINKYADKLNPQMPLQSAFILSPKLNVQYAVTNNLQLYAKWGKGFHSNDSRVVVLNEGRKILPAAYGYDFGITLKPFKNLFINAAYWKLNLEQEFVYVGDEGVIEPSGKTERRGVDINIRYQINKKLFVDISYNAAKARSIEQMKGQDFIPLAPTLTSVGGITYQSTKGWNGSLRYRYMQNRAANEDNSVIAKGYFVADAAINYTKPKYEIGLVVENLFNARWNEAQFNTTSRLKNEPTEVTELHYTPGSPFFAKVKLTIFF